jgi:acyl-CoA thioester hydrolase
MKFRWQTRILFIDTDASGRIHYTAMFRYFEAAELELFRALKIGRGQPEISLPRVHVECEYSGAIRFDDLLMIEVSVGRVGKTSIELRFLVLNEEVQVAAGSVVIVCMDRGTQRATAVPEEFRVKLAPYVDQ